MATLLVFRRRLLGVEREGDAGGIRTRKEEEEGASKGTEEWKGGDRTWGALNLTNSKQKKTIFSGYYKNL